MSSRLSGLSRQLLRPLPNCAHTHRGTVTAMATSSAALPIHTKQQSSSSSHQIHTAGCIIIGDEVLGGKTVDTNSAFMAKFCFSLGMSMKRIEVIADDEDEIIEAARRMSRNYDFVVTSGGIGPTHDDITYQSIAKAFNLPLKLHKPTVEKMRRLSKQRPQQPPFDWDTPSPALSARLRMAQLPWDDSKPEAEQAIYVSPDLWVPVSVVNGNVHILPGVPRLFEALLTGLRPTLLPRLADPDGRGLYRVLFSTPLPESAVAPFLTELAAKVEPRGVKVGSYPRWGKNKNIVTLVGKDREYMDSLEDEVARGVEGKRVQKEGEDDTDDEGDNKTNAKTSAGASSNPDDMDSIINTSKQP